MYKVNLALNNLQRLICHKTKLSQTIYKLVAYRLLSYEVDSVTQVQILNEFF